MKAKFLATEGSISANEAFLLEYQRCILIDLERRGILQREQAEECIQILKNQYQ